MWSYSVVQRVRRLRGQPLHCSADDAGVCGERGYGAGSNPTCDSAVSPCFHGCPAFLHRHFPSQSPPSPPLDPSVHSQQQPSPWDCSSFQPLRLPGDLQPVRGVYGCSKDYLILISFRPPQFSCFSSDSDNCPDVGIGPLLRFPHLPRAGPVVLTLLFSPLVPSSC